MPQFDIISFFSQITFFASLFLLFYIFLTKNTLPKLSQNLKLNKKFNNFYILLAIKGLKDINLLSYIYKPYIILLHRIYKENLSLISIQKYINIIITTYIIILNWLEINNKRNIKIRLLKLNKIYLKILNDTYYSNQK